MALPAPVVAQLAALNTNVNRLLANRDRINNLFEDGLGASPYSFLSVANQQAVKNAIVADMQVAENNIQTVITALQAM